ncbi:MAG: methylated-DNA--[protein]-cysteine S-methyltransferase [Thermogutta sp.]
MGDKWIGVGAMETPIGSLAFLLSARGLVAVRLGYPNWRAATLAVMPTGMADHFRTGRLSRKIETSWPTFGPFRWMGAGSNSTPPDLACRLAGKIARYFGGEVIDFGDIPLDFGLVTPFQLQVWQACRSIPFGATMSYGRLAAQIGRASATRAVGRALGSNPIPLIVPCHRVVSADGGLCGYSGYGGIATKRRLLELERSAINQAAAKKV